MSGKWWLGRSSLDLDLDGDLDLDLDGAHGAWLTLPITDH